MPIEILMPALSPTMTEGTLAKWHKKEGDAIKSGDVLAEIETDKATMEFEAVDEGVLGKIVVPDGTAGVAVNALIGVILADGEDASALASVGTKAAAPVAAAPVAAPVVVAAPAVAAVAAPVVAAVAVSSGTRVFASPLARRIAANAGFGIDRIVGTGPHGRIVKADVEAAIAKGPQAAPVAAAPVAAVAAPAAPVAANPFEPAFVEQPNSSMRKVIAKRLTEAKQTIPHFYLSIDVELDALLKVRAELNGRSDRYKLSVNDFIIRAVALGLKKVPAANASWGDTAIKRYTDIDVSVAVATPSGLITPVIRHADHKGMVEISSEIKALAAKARDGKLMPEEYQGGGFTISNLGMYGVKDFSAIINPPQGAILAVGAGEQRPVVKNGALAIATVMTVTLSVDHRVIDGAVGAEFLAAFKPLIEDPLSMLL